MPPHPALLPTGFRDVLPPEAEAKAGVMAALGATFASHGYQRIEPPFMEFEEGLLGGSGGAIAEQTFRLMDPGTHRMMALRADMTPQVARIAGTRLSGDPRPLRLAYSGHCLRTRGGGLAADRQVAQAGIELIGAEGPEADAEVVLVAAEALAAVGLSRVSFDLCVPPLAATLLDEAGFQGPARQALHRALDRKDAAEVARFGGRLAGTLNALLLAAGAADGALAALAAADLPPASAALRAHLEATVAAIRARAPALRITLDPIEFRGFRYQTGVCVTVYAPERQEEVGRGGRYLSNETELAVGLTLYPDAILRAIPGPAPRPRVFVPIGEDAAAAGALRAGGYATVAALTPVEDPAIEARRLGCRLILRDGVAIGIDPG